jgi:NADH:ubiquinone oxidoreductase subunit 4 (subunit M)
MLSLVQRIFYGNESKLTALKAPGDLNIGEWATLAPLVLLMLVMGLAPAPWLYSIQTGIHPPPLNGSTTLPASVLQISTHGEVLR